MVYRSLILNGLRCHWVIVVLAAGYFLEDAKAWRLKQMDVDDRPIW
jgi:hypothetical protein